LQQNSGLAEVIDAAHTGIVTPADAPAMLSPLKRYGYLCAYIVPALMPLAALAATAGLPIDLAAWLPLFVLFVLIPLADYALGHDARNPADENEATALEADPWFRLLTLAALPVQLALIAWSTWYFSVTDFSIAGAAGWLWSQGVVSSTLGITVAHELIHRRERIEQWAGGLLLSSVCYGGFKIEHVRGHHVHVATPLDTSSACKGESVYPFIARALSRNPIAAWRLEAERLAKLGLPALHWRNEMLLWSVVSLAFALLAAALLGIAGLLFFLAQAVIAAATLEVINYVEHYGLSRRRLADGRYERTTHRHSWNSDYLLSNLLLFQLQRHSDHHETARRRYQALRHHADSPQLPGGYSTMFLLALVPPLWRHVIDPRVDRYLTVSSG
jgi:alkane 1-monooxygenase